ncbi:MAG TPA: hypothetical protein DEB31_09010 [Clostridiales bacterium]|nr:hypothetical protein [Clostridiales bacterium]
MDPKVFPFGEGTLRLLHACEQKVLPQFKRYEEIAQINQMKVIAAFQKNQVSSRHFNPSTGYGYGDEGRDKLADVFAAVFSARAAIVSPMLMSGTHAITTALFGMLKPGEGVVSITGEPYDTLKSALSGSGSLREYGVEYYAVPLLSGGGVDFERVFALLRRHKAITTVYIQRSTGYEMRGAFTSDKIGEIIGTIKSEFPDKLFFVDNCYGEFVCDSEPTGVGADVAAGSLIKNPGGGLAPTGGYIAGSEALIERIANRFSAPGIGREIGSYAYGYQYFYQGLFMAPHTVLQALKGVILASAVFSELGYKTTPSFEEERGDITQTIVFGNEADLTAFVRGVQRASAVDGHVVPYAWDMPGYDDKVIMAAGTFVQGASLELTADAPIRPPYCAYLQGALTYEHAKLGILFALDALKKG